MPDTDQLNAFLSKITAGAGSEEERKKRIEQFAKTVNALYASPVSSALFPVHSTIARAATDQAPLIPISRQPNVAATANPRALAPNPSQLAAPTGSETVQPGAYQPTTIDYQPQVEPEVTDENNIAKQPLRTETIRNR